MSWYPVVMYISRVVTHTLVCLVILCEQKCVIKIQQHFFTSAHSQGTRHQPNTSIVKQAKKADGNAHLDQKETKK